jgi:MFS family permease
VKRGSTGWLLSICLAQIFIMLIFESYPAVLPVLQKEWGLSYGDTGWIYSAYQIGFLISVVILSTLTDRYNTKYIFLLSAFWSGIAAAAFAIFAQGLVSALVLRTLGGLGMGGTYIPGLKLVSEQFTSQKKGWAVGMYSGSLMTGIALSLALTGIITSMAGWRLAYLASSFGPIIGTIVAYFSLKDIERVDYGSMEGGFTKEVIYNKPIILLTLAYVAHNWEAFGMRGWTPAFLTAYLVRSGQGVSVATGYAASLASIITVIGILATVVGGVLSDKMGRSMTTILIMSLGAICSLTFGWLMEAPFSLVIIIGLLYGFFVVADTSCLTTAITELASPAYLGSAMAFFSLLGWSLGTISPAVFGYILDLTNPTDLITKLNYVPHWGWAFSLLGLGAIIGPIAMWRLRLLPESEKMAQGKR